MIFSTSWVDLQYWEDDCSWNGITAIKKLVEIFSESFNTAGFNRSKVFAEWNLLRSTIKSCYFNFDDTVDIWYKLFLY